MSATWRQRPPGYSVLTTMLAALVLLALALPALAYEPKCLESADHIKINKLFTNGGPGFKVYLCKGKTYRLSGTIVFTGADQELATLGYPEGDERATLLVTSEFVDTAIQGDCRRCARVALRNIIVDGGRPLLGRARDAGAAALVVLGAHEGHVVRDCWLRNPRGWTALHVREGDKLQCKGAVVENNQIGPAGNEYDPAVDGPDPEVSPLGRPLADGISIACRDSVVRDNTIVDCTLTGISVYCSPGTLVAGNTVSTVKHSAMGGIFMVDATPFDGDYTGVVVRDNTFDASRRAMRVGIGIGLSILSDDIETVLRGGTVTNNGFQGRFMGYGIAASGLTGWTVKDNWSTAQYQGKRSARCFEDVINPDPMPFLYHQATVEDSDFQTEFHDQDFAYIVCIDGLETTDAPLVETPVQDPTTAAEVGEPVEEDVEPEGTGSDALDGILLHVQDRMTNAIAIMGRNIDNAIDAAKASSRKPARGGQDAERASPKVHTALADIDSRLDTLERAQVALMDDTLGLAKQIRKIKGEVAKSHEWQHDVLLHLQQEFYAQPKHAHDNTRGSAKTHPTRPRKVQALEHASAGESGIPLPVYAIAGVVFAGAGYRFWRRSRKVASHRRAKSI